VNGKDYIGGATVEQGYTTSIKYNHRKMEGMHVRYHTFNPEFDASYGDASESVDHQDTSVKGKIISQCNCNLSLHSVCNANTL